MIYPCRVSVPALTDSVLMFIPPLLLLLLLLPWLFIQTLYVLQSHLPALALSRSLSILRCLLCVSLPSFSLSWRGFQFGQSARTVSRNLPLRLFAPRPPDPRSADNGAQTACSFIKGGGGRGNINSQRLSGVCVRVCARARICVPYCCTLVCTSSWARELTSEPAP